MNPSDDITLLLERLSRVLHNESHAAGLKPTQWEALRFLARANRFSRSPSAVTVYLGMTKGTVSQTLNALERKGLIRKKTDPGNRRTVQLELTDGALALLQRDPLENLLQSASRLQPAEQRRLATDLGELLRDMLKRRGGRPFGVCKTCRFFQADAPAGAPHRCGLLNVPLTENDSERICIEQETAA